MSHRTLNVSAYKFVTLQDLPTLKNRVLELAQRHALLGTVLLAEEGINLFLAGPEPDVQALLVALRADARLADLDAKLSWSDEPPFKKLIVKIKREIIRMNQPQVRPDAAPRSPAVAPERLRQWLDQGSDEAGRPVVMLDTRNDFEVGYGQFEAAQHWSLGKFSDFPSALAKHVDSLRDVTVVSYCTGGIRCEKAAMLLRAAGLTHSYQLDGGILRYFERVGDAHWQGTCFVFDEREALGAAL